MCTKDKNIDNGVSTEANKQAFECILIHGFLIYQDMELLKSSLPVFTTCLLSSLHGLLHIAI